MKIILLVGIIVLLAGLGLLDIFLHNWFLHHNQTINELSHQHNGEETRAKIDLLTEQIIWVRSYAKIVHVIVVLFILICLVAYIFL